MPAELHDVIWEKLAKGMEQGMEVRWARVCMRLGEVLSGRFFEEYIKTGELEVSSFAAGWCCV
jgi:hypothetical protein